MERSPKGLLLQFGASPKPGSELLLRRDRGVSTNLAPSAAPGGNSVPWEEMRMDPMDGWNTEV